MRLLALLAFLAALCLPAWTQSAPSDPQQLLETAFQRSDLFHAANTPFVFEADFTAQLRTPTQGKVLIRWGSKDRWRMEIKLGPFAMVKTRNGEQTLLLQNLPFTPPLVRELITLLRLDPFEETMSAHKLKQRQDHGQLATCIDYTLNIDDSHSTRACLDLSTGDLLSTEIKTIEEDGRKEFSQYADFDGRLFPRHIRKLSNGNVVLSVEVTRLASEPFDNNLLSLPKQAIARRECDSERPPKATTMTEMEWPSGIGNTKMTAELTVLEDGSVGDVQITEGSSPAMNNTVVKGLKTWKFKPAMCGPDPVVRDIAVDINFERR